MSDAKIRALKILCRLRQVETDEARRGLGETMARETALAANEAAMEGELKSAREVTGDFDRDAFSAWFERKVTERARLSGAIRDAEACTLTARSELSNRRVAETAAKETLAREILALETATERREQIMLEDVARALKRAAES